MPKVINVSRKFAALEATKEYLEKIDPQEWVWIFIGEPNGDYGPKFNFSSGIENLPTLKIDFWDVSAPQLHFDFSTQKEFTAFPITQEQAREIYQFLNQHKGKNIICSCFAGRCRSGAVAQFCEKYLKYNWPEEFKAKANPNNLVFVYLEGAWWENFPMNYDTLQG